MREEEKKYTSPKFLKRRWAYPAIYLASAAIIITGILWYQAGNDDEKAEDYSYDVPTDNEFNQPAEEVNRSLENFVMPVSSPEDTVIEKNFYDAEASAEEQEAALVVYGNMYYPNQGIDISKDGKEFDVLAAMSGTVTKVQEDSLLGNTIEIEHSKGIVTRYQSVKDFEVAVGDVVDQGQAIAKAGKSLFNEDAGVHVHFEIRKDSVAVNPINYFNKSLATLQEAKLDEQKVSGDQPEAEAAQEDAVKEDAAAQDEAKAEEGAEGADEKADPSDAEQKDSESNADAQDEDAESNADTTQEDQE
ncbi:peptidase M23 [[Bacillus] enclensis]|uniref:Stage II sporulation protein Q n=2 Tax=Rossellomorea TaxID=2837508 RepID=A0A0V8HE10_9BACI|nr:M23 family metallopeptidase [[Bacillus] enclensis]OAT81039.1 peptidase M23 [Bacillus sp. MKU004]QTC40529.1 peptidoglycan DD-metalloendopeptidase family protein [Bacillus sp. V3]KSU60480.1 peptidase M23 [[Bacillus] enclensis]MBH9966675.1 peptidoglycan DD-metalloendopeptidase family protein [[Bacillus] enclensis]SCC25051.1 stage II sporulation protein Q [[Bacillus] enclensis]